MSEKSKEKVILALAFSKRAPKKKTFSQLPLCARHFWTVGCEISNGKHVFLKQHKKGTKSNTFFSSSPSLYLEKKNFHANIECHFTYAEHDEF